MFSATLLPWSLRLKEEWLVSVDHSSISLPLLPFKCNLLPSSTAVSAHTEYLLFEKLHEKIRIFLKPGIKMFDAVHTDKNSFLLVVDHENYYCKI